MLAVVFEEFKVFHIFLLLFFLFNSLSFSIDKRSTLAKIWGGEGLQPAPAPGFYGPVSIQIFTEPFKTLHLRFLTGF